VNSELSLRGLLLYLQIRNWALNKMMTQAHGSAGLDIEIHQYLYLSNSLAALDIVGEAIYGRDFRNPVYKTEFEVKVISSFQTASGSLPISEIVPALETYGYVRELRNGAVHRGVQSTSGGHSNGTLIAALCPEFVTDLKGTKTYRRPCRYVLELAQLANVAINDVIYSEIEARGLLVPVPSNMTAEDMIQHVSAAKDVPNIVKENFPKIFVGLDMASINMQMAQTTITQIRSLLGH
jgi:hypothetical protein